MQPFPDDWARAVAVVAHPDDLEYGVASAVARWTDEGREVAYVLASSGEAGIDGVPPAESGPLREEEERASAALVGVTHVEFLGHPDGAIEYSVALRRDLAAAYRRLRPDIVVAANFDFTWGEGGAVNHADHRAVGVAAIDACRDASNRWMFTDAGEPWSGIRSVYVAGSNSPTHFVDVTNTLDRGVESLRAHDAYIKGLGREFDPQEFLTNIAGFGGMAAGCEYAVLFHEFQVG